MINFMTLDVEVSVDDVFISSLHIIPLSFRCGLRLLDFTVFSAYNNEDYQSLTRMM
jgi:hypothetical protein